jgi:hypothetical protein
MENRIKILEKLVLSLCEEVEFLELDISVLEKKLLSSK